MEKRTQEAFRWIQNRVHKKTKIKQEVTAKVLETIADLYWDWSHSKYDLYGIQIEDLLEDLGKSRAPKETP